MEKKGIFLDVDTSLVENNLKLVNDEAADQFEKLLQNEQNNYPCKYITPSPGFCVKTRITSSGGKFFVNVCHSDIIPVPPKDFTNLSVEEILDKDVEFRVPMSIGQIRKENDAKGGQCDVCDVVINTLFFAKIQNNTSWKNFLLTIIFEAMKEKYQIDCIEEVKIILQNKKHVGNLQRHRIQDREMAKKMGITDLPKLGGAVSPKIEMLSTQNFEKRRPIFRLFKKKDKQSCLIGEFKFPDVISAKELKLEVGEDRIIIECEERNYYLDVFVPAVLRPDTCSSAFDISTKVLSVTMPIVGG